MSKMKNSLVGSRLGGLMGGAKAEPKQLDIERDTGAGHYPRTGGGYGMRDFDDIPDFLDRRKKQGAPGTTQSRGHLNDDIGHLGREPARDVRTTHLNVGSYAEATIRHRLVKPTTSGGKRVMMERDRAELADAMWATFLDCFDRQKLVLKPEMMRACKTDFFIVVEQLLEGAKHLRIDGSHAELMMEDGDDDDGWDKDEAAALGVEVFVTDGLYRYEVKRDGECLATGAGYGSTGEAKAAGIAAAKSLEPKPQGETAEQIKWRDAECDAIRKGEHEFVWTIFDKFTGELILAGDETFATPGGAIIAGDKVIQAHREKAGL